MNSCLRIVLFGALTCGSASLLQAQPAQDAHPVVLDADSWSFNQQLGKFEFKGLKISQAGLSLEAEHALGSGLEFEDSHWQLIGQVRLEIDSAVISADEAAFTFENQQLTVSALTGSPALFDITNEAGDQSVHGSSERILFDSLAGTISMEGNASLIAGQLNARGCQIVYSLQGEGVSSGDSECGERFQITIVAPAEDETPTDPAQAP